MSTQVDHRVVEMKFDNKQFEQNVSTTMSTLDKLKQKLNLSGATKGLEEMDRAAKKVDMSHLGNAVETVRVKFSTLQVMGVTALANLTNSAVNAGKRITKALTIEPVKTGFQEYETQMNAVQTILANTSAKGNTLDDVNNALDELNTYADKTIYNFTEMTKNIGTFTAAGVDLDKSVASIKGIANLAAVSGSTSQQASTAMYQLSQALAAGKVQLMDWNSVVNAGMGGEIFQNALKRTATQMGTNVDAMIDKFGSFRESLTQGEWLTAEVLTETLNQLSGAYTEADLMNQGYTKKQAAEIVKLAETASSAATDVKTFSQLWDTLKETAQSGWTQTWEIVVGDFEESKSLWSGLYKRFSAPIEKMSARRNTMLENALGGGDDLWGKYIERVNKAGIKTEDFQASLAKMAKKHGVSTKTMEKAEKNFAESLKEGWLTKDILKDTLNDYVEKSKKFASSTDDMKKKLKTFQDVFDGVWKGSYKNGKERVDALTKAGFEYSKVQDIVNKHGAGYKLTLDDISDAQLKQAGYTKDQIEQLRSLADEANNSGKSMDELIKSLTRVDGRTLLLEGFGNFAEQFGKIFEAIREAWDETFKSDETGGGLYSVIESFHDLSESFEISETAAENFKKVFEGLFAILQLGSGLISKTWTTAFKLLSAILTGFDTDLLTVAAGIGEYITRFRDWVKENTLYIGTIDKVAKGISNFITTVGDCLEAIWKFEPVQDFLDRLTTNFEYLFSTFEGFDLAEITEMLGYFAETLKEWLSLHDTMDPKEWREMGVNIVKGLIEGITSYIGNLIKSIFNLGKEIILTFCEVLGIHSPSTEAIEIGINFMKGFILGIGELIPALMKTIKVLCEEMMNALQEFDIDIGALAIFGVVVAMLVLANKIIKIMDRILKPAEGFKDRMASLLEDMGGHINKYIDAKAWQAKAEAIKSIAIAILVLVGALALLQTIDVDKVWMPLLALTALTGILVGLVFAMTKFEALEGLDFIKIGILMLTMATSMSILAKAVERLAQIEFGAAMGAVLELSLVIAAMSGLMYVFGKFVDNPEIAKNIDKAGSMIFRMAIGIGALVVMFKLIGQISWDEVKHALGVFALISLVFAGFIAVSTLSGQYADKAGKMLTRMAIAMGVLAVAMHIMAALDGSEIKKALAVIGYVGVVFAAFVALSTFAGKYAGRAGFMLFEISLAFGILALTIRLLANTSKEDIKKGLKVLRQAMHMFTTFMVVSMVAGKNAAKAGILLLGMAGAITILSIAIKIIGSLSEQDIKRGMVVISVFSAWCAAFMALSVYAGENASKAGTMLFKMSMAILILVAAIALLSLLKPEDIKTATIAISALIGMFALLVAATKYAQDCMKSLIVMSVAIGLLGATLIVLSKLDPKNVTAAAGAMSSVVGMFAILTGMSKFAGGELKTLIIMIATIALIGKIIKKLAKLEPESAIGAATAISILLLALSVAFRIIGTPGATITPTAIAALGVMVVAIGLIGIVLGLLQKLNVNPSIETAIALSILLVAMSGACLILAAVGATGPAALIGAAILDGVILVLGGLMVGIGALMTHVPAAEEFLDKGMVVLEKIGYGLGSILGGFSAGLTAGLPEIGQNLGDFMTNAKPFFDMIKNVDDKTVSSVQSLANSISTLVKADFVDQFTFGSSIVDFGEQLIPFGESIVKYSKIVSSLDETAITGIKNSASAAKALTEVANAIPDSKALFSNEHDMTAFADQLIPFANGLVSYSKVVSGIDEASIVAINTSTKAAQGLAALADAIPDSEGLFSNENNLVDFGRQLVPFGTSLTAFLDSVAGVDETSVAKVDISIAAAKGLVKLADSVPDSKGIFSDKNNLKSFGNKLKSFGGSLADYSNSVTGLSASAIDTSVTSVNKLVKMFDKVSKVDTSGVKNFKTGLKQLGKISVSDFTAGFDGSTSKLTEAGSRMVTAIKNGINTKKSVITSAGKTLVTELANGIDNNKSLVLDSINTMMTKADGKIDSYYDNFKSSGKYVVEGFAEGITDKTWYAEAKAKAMANAAEKAAKDALDVNSPSKVFRRLGYSVPEGLAQGIDRMSNVVRVSAVAMAKTGIESVSKSISKIADVVDSDMDSQPTIRPIVDLSDVESGANAINNMLDIGPSIGVSSNIRAINRAMNTRNQNGPNADVVSAINKLNKGLSNVGNNTTYNVNGVTSNSGDVNQAISDLVRMIVVEGRV